MKQTNQLKIGVLISYISTALNILIQLMYTPIMIRLLGQSEYGLYTLVGSVVSYLSLFSLGFTGAYLRFSTRCELDSDSTALPRLNGMFLSLFLAMSAAALVCGMILSQFTPQLFSDKLTVQETAKAKLLMQILVVNIAMTFPASIFDAMVSAHEQFLFQRLVTLASILFNPMLCLPMLLMGYDSIAIVSVTTFITFLKLAVNIWFCLRKLCIPFLFRNFEIPLLKEIAGFSFFLFLNMIIDQVNLSIGKIILGRVSGTAAVAVYGVGAQINALYYTFSTTVSSVFAPRVNRIAAENELDHNAQYTALMVRVGRIQFLILGLILSGFFFFGKYFVTEIYSSPEYAQAYAVALLLILPSTVPLIQNIGIEIQRALNKHQFRAVVYSFMALSNVLITIPCSKKLGPVGAALGTAISLVIANGLVMNLYYHKKIHLDMILFWRQILMAFLGVLPGLLIGFAINHWIEIRNIVTWLLWIAIYVAGYGISAWLLAMNPFEKDLIRGPVKKLLSIGMR